MIKAGGWPWAHTVIMETKEHWGLLLPLIVTTAALLALGEKPDESRPWWLLTIGLAIALAVLGRVVKLGAGVPL